MRLSVPDRSGVEQGGGRGVMVAGAGWAGRGAAGSVRRPGPSAVHGSDPLLRCSGGCCFHHTAPRRHTQLPPHQTYPPRPFPHFHPPLSPSVYVLIYLCTWGREAHTHLIEMEDFSVPLSDGGIFPLFPVSSWPETGTGRENVHMLVARTPHNIKV